MYWEWNFCGLSWGISLGTKAAGYFSLLDFLSSCLSDCLSVCLCGEVGLDRQVSIWGYLLGWRDAAYNIVVGLSGVIFMLGQSRVVKAVSLLAMTFFYLMVLFCLHVLIGSPFCLCHQCWMLVIVVFDWICLYELFSFASFTLFQCDRKYDVLDSVHGNYKCNLLDFYLFK